MSSLYFYNQFNSTLTKIVGDYFWFNSSPTTSSEYRWGLGCVFGHSRWSSLVASKSLIVHSWRPKFRQDRAQGIPEDCQCILESLLPKRKSKVFWNPSQSTTEFQKFWRRFYRLSINHWRQVIRKQSLYSKREINQSHLYKVKTQGSKSVSQLHCKG